MKRRRFISNTLLSTLPFVTFRQFGQSLTLANEIKPKREIGMTNGVNPFYTSGSVTGDAFPFYFEGEWHIFHMRMPNIAHLVTKDFLTYHEYPDVISPGGHGTPDSNGGATGCIIEHKGKFYCFYTGNQNVCLATSNNLRDWKKYGKNPLWEGDNVLYDKENFRDPYVFFNEDEGLWWMLIGTKMASGHRQRTGCVGLAKSTNLIEWSTAKPLWNPGVGPHMDCPQLVKEKDKWFLLYLHRNTLYQHARSPEGPFMRVFTNQLGTALSNAGSRVATDGNRWISLPFITQLKDQNEYGDWKYGGIFCVPRELSFHSDGSVTEAPVREKIIDLQTRKSIFNLEKTKPLTGNWILSQENLACESQSGGTLLINDSPKNAYIELDIDFSVSNMQAHILFRLDSQFHTGYQLSLHSDTQMLYLRPLSEWDTALELAARPINIVPQIPVKVRIFFWDSVLDVFVADKYSLSARLYRYKEGEMAVEFRDGLGTISNVRIVDLGF